MTLTRTRLANGAVFIDAAVPNLRGARMRVAWAMTDNAGQSRAEASRVSDRLTISTALTAHGYRFELTR